MQNEYSFTKNWYIGQLVKIIFRAIIPIIIVLVFPGYLDSLTRGELTVKQFMIIAVIVMLVIPSIYLSLIAFIKSGHTIFLNDRKLQVPLGIIIFKNREIGYGDISSAELNQDRLDKILGTCSIKITHESPDQRNGIGGGGIASFYKYGKNWYLVQGLSLKTGKELLERVGSLKTKHSDSKGVLSESLIANPEQPIITQMPNLKKLFLGVILLFIVLPLIFLALWIVYLYMNGENIFISLKDQFDLMMSNFR